MMRAREATSDSAMRTVLASCRSLLWSAVADAICFGTSADMWGSTRKLAETAIKNTTENATKDAILDVFNNYRRQIDL